MAMNQPFTTASPILVNYDWTDFTGDTGYIRFYGAAATTSTATTYFLTKQTPDSQPNKTNVAYAGGGTTALNFDIEMKKNNTIKGDAIFNFSYNVRDAGAQTGYVTITVYHVAQDTTETSLGTARTATRDSTSNYRGCLQIELTEKTFTPGETLRVSADVTIGGAETAYFYHDPASGISLTDNLSRTIGTDFTCDIPFKINR